MKSDSSKYCPICGEQFQSWPGHRCDEKKLANIERALSTDRVDSRNRERSFGFRLSEGFALLHEDVDSLEQGFDA